MFLLVFWLLIIGSALLYLIKMFITLALESGISVSEVMTMSTHKDFRSLSRYISLERERINTKLQSVFALDKVS